MHLSLFEIGGGMVVVTFRQCLGQVNGQGI